MKKTPTVLIPLIVWMLIVAFLIIFSMVGCKNEKPYLIDSENETYYDKKLIDSIYIKSDTIIDAVYNPILKK